jgi:hypothetical protein
MFELTLPLGIMFGMCPKLTDGILPEVSAAWAVCVVALTDVRLNFLSGIVAGVPS